MTSPHDTNTGARKRNDRCRNKVCACTGECFIDDGTGDFAKPADNRIKLERLRSRMLGWQDCDDEIEQLRKPDLELLRKAVDNVNARYIKPHLYIHAKRVFVEYFKLLNEGL